MMPPSEGPHPGFQIVHHLESGTTHGAWNMSHTAVAMKHRVLKKIVRDWRQKSDLATNGMEVLGMVFEGKLVSADYKPTGNTLGFFVNVSKIGPDSAAKAILRIIRNPKINREIGENNPTVYIAGMKGPDLGKYSTLSEEGLRKAIESGWSAESRHTWSTLF